MPLIPENLTEFLHWVKDRTEAYWATLPPDDWQSGARWQPLTEEQIEEVESRYAIQFPHEHREFLKVLHTLDRWEEWEAEEEIGVFTTVRAPFFYNWLQDRNVLLYRLAWPHTLLLDSEEQAHMRSSPEPNPKALDERIQRFEELFAKAPKLLPLRHHTFSVSDKESRYSLITSMYGHDSIVLGKDMRHFVAGTLEGSIVGADLVQEIGTYECVDPLSIEIYNLRIRGFQSEDFRQVPYWGDLIWKFNKAYFERAKEWKLKET